MTIRSPLGWAAVAGLVILSVLAFTTDTLKVLGIAWVAFAAMVGGIILGVSTDVDYPRRLVWGYGGASGAMVTSASVFLLPQAIGQAPAMGGYGVAAGLLGGYGAHIIGHRLGHIDIGLDVTAAKLAAHALAAGTIIGLIYGAMPSLGLVLGLAIVSHKAPAGYAAANRLKQSDRPVDGLLLPAAGVGLTAIPAALLPLPNVPAANAVLFGFATGVFLHVAMDFLPSCEVGGEVDQITSLSEHSHRQLDRLRLHAVASTALGGLAVLIAWIVLTT